MQFFYLFGRKKAVMYSSGKKTYVLLFCLWFAKWTAAQYYQVQLYQVEQGLPTNISKSIIQDRYGFAWIAGDAGMVRFDGKSFLHFKNALSSDYTKHIIRRENGDILVAHDKGVTKIVCRPDTVNFQDLFPDTQRNSIVAPKRLYEDRRKRLWIGQDQAIACLLPNGKLVHYPFPLTERTTSWNRSFSFAETIDGSLYVASQRGHLFRFDEHS
ncbi:MAG: hypothetical protein NZM34_05090 [Bernardetiaceae bacterium]|nr:hypothetical protein [Bernardetiaceae bacterium]